MSRWAEMRRVASKGYWREADARVVVTAWQESGETIAGFARRHGVDRQRLARWRSRLGSAATTAVQFHAVRLAETRRSGGPDAATIEIELSGGRLVRLCPGFGAEDLRRVMAVLDESRC